MKHGEEIPGDHARIKHFGGYSQISEGIESQDTVATKQSIDLTLYAIEYGRMILLEDVSGQWYSLVRPGLLFRRRWFIINLGRDSVEIAFDRVRTVVPES